MTTLLSHTVRRVNASTMTVILSIPDISFDRAHTLCADLERWCARQQERGVDIDTICSQARIDAHRDQLHSVRLHATVDAPVVRIAAYPAGWKLPKGATVIGFADTGQLTIADAIPAAVTDAVARKLSEVCSLHAAVAIARVVHPGLDAALLNTPAGFAATLPAEQLDMLAA